MIHALLKMEGEMGGVRKLKKRKRFKGNVGRSDVTHIKHQLIETVVSAHVAVLVKKFGTNGTILDMNAGDGEGTEKPQMDLFGDNPSCTTAELTARTAEKVGAQAILCEKNAKQREILKRRFPYAMTISNHKNAVGHIVENCKWIVVISDPNGPKDHGIEIMQQISLTIPQSDFIVVFNENSTGRILGVKDWSEETEINDSKHNNSSQINGLRKKKICYQWMMNADRSMPNFTGWRVKLGKNRISSTNLIKASRGFHYRIMVISNFLTDAATRGRFREVI